MVQISRIETFVKRAIWRITRSGSIIKYVPRSIHNGVVVGDCAVIRNKKHTFDVYSKQRQPIKKDVCNHKVAICIATIMNQYNQNFADSLKNLTQLDNEYAFALGNYHNLKHKLSKNPHLEDEFDSWESKLVKLSDQIQHEFESMTL